jgi:hypothetical protein
LEFSDGGSTGFFQKDGATVEVTQTLGQESWILARPRTENNETGDVGSGGFRYVSDVGPTLDATTGTLLECLLPISKSGVFQSPPGLVARPPRLDDVIELCGRDATV